MKQRIIYNSFWDLNRKFFLDITCFGKNQQPVFFKLTLELDHKTTKRIFGNIKNENNEWLSQIPNGFRCFCMNLIKEQFSKQ